MARRLELQTLLESLLGSRNVYFQPPATVKMSYPCIVYSKDPSWVIHANDKQYQRTQRYQVTVIDRDPDSLIPGIVSRLPHCRETSTFSTSGLNHDVFSLYF